MMDFPPPLMTDSPLVSYVCNVQQDLGSSGQIEFRFREPLLDGARSRALQNITVVDAESLMPSFPGGMRGEIRETDVIEFFPRKNLDKRVTQWARIVKHRGTERYDVFIYRSASGHPIITDVITGTCTHDYVQKRKSQ